MQLRFRDGSRRSGALLADQAAAVIGPPAAYSPIVRSSASSAAAAEHVDQDFDHSDPDYEIKSKRQQSPPIQPHPGLGPNGFAARATLRPNCNVGHSTFLPVYGRFLADTLRPRDGESP
jgi:hypothetical protein